MPTITLKVNDLRKDFNRRPIFAGVSFELSEGRTLAISGRNGSGKSTLLKVIASLLSQTAGTVSLRVDGVEVAPRWMFRYIGMVAPYLHLYEEFSALENLALIDSIRGAKHTGSEYESLLAMVSLEKRKHDVVRTFSSGMKQRLKYALAWMERPPLMLLDEPRTNLDADGISMMKDLFDTQRGAGVVIVATNEEEDVVMCDERISLSPVGTVDPRGGAGKGVVS
jgi:heme exporter protein A